jgi:hypothetical protein
MKTISAALAAHLAGDVTTLASCWRISRRDGREFFFTDHDRDLVFEDEIYLASSGYSRSAIANEAGLAVDNLDVEDVFDHEQISEQDLRAGLFDHAEVNVFLVNWADLSQGKHRLRRGWFGEVQLSEAGMFRTELRGLTQALSTRIGEIYSPECRADLGDHRCRVPIEPPLIARNTLYAVGDVVRVAALTAGPERYPLPLVNAGFDEGDPGGWTVVSGSVTVKTANSPLVAHAGTHFLDGGAVASFEIRQTVDLANAVDLAVIDAGRCTLDVRCFRANSGSDSQDQGRVIAELADAAGAPLATLLDSGSESFAAGSGWHERAAIGAAVPAGSRSLRLRFLGTRVNGTACNAALDSVAATVTDPLASLQGAAVFAGRLYTCITAGTTAAEQPAYATAIGAETADGAAVFAASEAWTRAGKVAQVIDRRTVVALVDEPRASDGWFAGGVLTWESGPNAGRSMEVKAWSQATQQLTLFLPAGYAIAAGDRFRLAPGCDKRLDSCSARFVNVLNFRGEPYVPGQDALLRYPDAY